LSSAAARRALRIGRQIDLSLIAEAKDQDLEGRGLVMIDGVALTPTRDPEVSKQMNATEKLRLRRKSAYSRLPLVHRVDLEGQQRVELTRS
jgi:hypothetical protein